MAHIHHSTGTIVATIQYIIGIYDTRGGSMVRDTDL